MILLPYIHRIKIVNQIPVHSYTILTIGGKQLWAEDVETEDVEDAEAITQILINNDVYADSIKQHDDIYLCSINTEKTNIADFYTWNEIIDSDTFCWRTLYTFGEHQNWLPHPTGKIGMLTYQTICNMISTSI